METAPWPEPDPEVTELIRYFATTTLQDTGPLFEIVDRAVIEGAGDRLAAEPALVDAITVANHANLTHWMAANAASPGARVPANVGPEILELSRDMVRRGLDDISLNAYRVGQNAALRYLMDQVFEVSDDVELIRELLEVSSISVFTFVDDTLAAIEEQVGAEREALARGTHAERLATVNLILEGAPIGERRAGSRLGYELDASHRAAVVWSDGTPPPGALEGAAEELARAAAAARPFTVVASARSLWVWCAPRGATSSGEESGAEGGGPIDPERLDPSVRVAVGPDAPGLEGFRRSHLGALATQRLMQRARHPVRVASYPEIELVALAAEDEQRALGFAQRTLGELAGAEPVLRETLLAYLRADLNASAAARGLFAHRNTVLNRLERVRELLPGPIEGRAVELGLALEIARWLGIPPGPEAA